MKYCRRLSLLWITIYMIHPGCSIPTMVIKHENQIDRTYERKGSVKIGLFEDNRPDEERIEDQTVSNSLSPQIWSGSTSPEMLTFFRKSLIDQAERTQLFTVEENAELLLSGHVTSMKVDRKVTILRYIGPAVIAAGILTAPLLVRNREAMKDYLGFAIGAGLVLTCLDFPVLNATVEFTAVLTLNGSQIFNKKIKVVEEDNYPAFTELGWKTVSDKASKVLDRAITKSIKMLFEEIISVN